MPTRSMPPTPSCKAMLLCDATIIEAVTGKVSIIGTFSEFHPQSRPIRLPAFQLFLQVSDAAGRYDLAVEIQDLRDRNTLVTARGFGIEIHDRLVNSNIIIPVPSMEVSRAGEFDIVVLANGDEISRQKFRINEVPNDPNPAAD